MTSNYYNTTGTPTVVIGFGVADPQFWFPIATFIPRVTTFITFGAEPLAGPVQLIIEAIVN